jgi:CubicO group peptidase (beta-lactamase class C family)
MYCKPRFVVLLAAALFLILGMAACGPAAAPPVAAAPEYSTVAKESAQLIQAAMKKNDITGLSVALVDDQQIVWSQGFGDTDKANGVKATPETVYGIASISKLFTAIAIMQLTLTSPC